MRSKAVLLGLALAASAAAGAASPAPQALAGGSFVCGGVGSDERRALAANAPDSNLSLELFAGKYGAYVADVDVRLHPAGSGATALSLVADGPICHLQLPPGRYEIEATFNGATRTAQARVPSRGRTHVAIAFPDAVGDRQSDIPTPEEKLQASRIP